MTAAAAQLRQPVTVVDAFTLRPFSGNPAAVCVVSSERINDQAWMQGIAQEMNLSETSFVAHDAKEPGTFHLKWFTPTTEINLCGHATLAAAHALWHTGVLAAGAAAVFHTASGTLRCDRAADGGIAMDFPQEVATEGRVPPGMRERVAAALPGLPITAVLRNRMDYLVVARDAAAVRALRPDIARIRSIGGRGVLVTSKAPPGEVRDGLAVDVVSRCFFPSAGVDEDPVTGSAHCAIGPYWAAALGRRRIVAVQASRRGGVLDIDVRGDGRCTITGRAVVTLHGAIDVGGYEPVAGAPAARM